MKSSADRYGTVAISIHWLSAALILALIASGLCAAADIDTATKAGLLRFHVPAAIVILLLTIVRIIWWWRFDRKPLPVKNSPIWQEFAARWTHITFYVLIVGMVLSGMGMMVLSGAGPTIFGQSTAELPRFTDYPPHRIHGLGAFVLAVLLACHVGAALHHHFIRRDGMLRRMWYGGDHHKPE